MRLVKKGTELLTSESHDEAPHSKKTYPDALANL